LEGKEISERGGSELVPCPERVIAVTSLAVEARIARGPRVAVICDYASHHLLTGLQEAVSAGAAGIISFGVAGGLAPELAPGDWVVAAGVWTAQAHFPADGIWAKRLLVALPRARHAYIAGSDKLLVHPAEKRALHGCSGAAVADMESHIAARVAAANGIPFAACRVVIDPAGEQLPPAAEVGLREDGRTDVLAVLASLAQRPGQLPGLVRIAYHAAIARAALREGRRSLGPALACPYIGALARPVSTSPADEELVLDQAGARAGSTT
jgi:adenosylhomocysteine nucleosidase